jgi:hypothetical protein
MTAPTHVREVSSDENWSDYSRRWCQTESRLLAKIWPCSQKSVELTKIQTYLSRAAPLQAPAAPDRNRLEPKPPCPPALFGETWP